MSPFKLSCKAAPKIFLFVVLFCTCALRAAAQDEQSLEIHVAAKAALAPQAGVNLYLSDRYEVDAHLYIPGSLGGTVFSVNALLRRRAAEDLVTRYGGNIMYWGGGSELVIGPLVGIEYRLTERIGLFGDITIGIGTGSGSFGMANTGLGLLYRIER